MDVEWCKVNKVPEAVSPLTRQGSLAAAGRANRSSGVEPETHLSCKRYVPFIGKLCLGTRDRPHGELHSRTYARPGRSQGGPEL